MKVLILNSVYGEGSTGKIVFSLADTLRLQGHNVMTLYGLGNVNVDEYSKRVCGQMEHQINAFISRVTGIPFGGIFLSNIRTKHIIEKFKPDVVHIHCINASTFNVYSILCYLAQAKIKTILTLHAEIFHTAGCEHAYECEKWKKGCNNCNVYRKRIGSWFFDRSKTSYNKMQEVINSFDTDKLTITAVSPWLAERAKQSAIMCRYEVFYVPNGVDTSIFYYKGNVELIDRESYQKVFLFVTPYLTMDVDDNKGSHFITKLALSLPQCKFIIVASRNIGEPDNLPTNVQLWGKAKSQDKLAHLYSEADATLLLSKRETFSMVTAESLCCGTPVFGFEAGGPESIALKNHCEFVEYGNVGLLAETLSSFINNETKDDISRAAIDAYSQNNMVAMYKDIYSGVSI